MNKEQIFALYLSNPKQKICYGADEVSNYLTGVYLGSKIDEPEVAEWKAICEDSEPLSLSDCQLILTPISEITGEDEEDYLNQRVKCENCHLNGCESFESMFWLITHGYALYDQWFTEGIAVRG